jgi:hypothetical protein
LTVTTYQSPSGHKLSICTACEARLSARGEWPRDSTGGEFCTVSHGAHDGACEWPEHPKRGRPTQADPLNRRWPGSTNEALLGKLERAAEARGISPAALLRDLVGGL